MKKKLSTFIVTLLGCLAFSSCSNSKKEITYTEALSILKKIDMEINYTPVTNIPKSYILSEKTNSYKDGNKIIENAVIDREIDQNNHYSFLRIKGTYEGRDYIHENWTYVARKNNVSCDYYNFVENGKISNTRYRQESEQSYESWDSVAKSDIVEMQRLYARMAKEYYIHFSELEENAEKSEFYSDAVGSLYAYISSDTETYSCEFDNYWFKSGTHKNFSEDTYYEASVSWNKCEISAPNLDFYPLLEKIS